MPLRKLLDALNEEQKDLYFKISLLTTQVNNCERYPSVLSIDEEELHDRAMNVPLQFWPILIEQRMRSLLHDADSDGGSSSPPSHHNSESEESSSD